MSGSRVTAFLAMVLFLLAGNGAQATSLPTKLFLSQDGLAFSDFPSRQVLSRTIEVDRTQGNGKVAWTALSDQTWLKITQSGETGGELKLKVSTAGLAKDQFYSATVTVSTENAEFADQETLRVGLWVGSADPGTVTFKKNALYIATNPVSPIAYVSDGSSTVWRYDVYSGAPLTSLKKVAASVGYMEVSSDGTTLFAADRTNYKIVAIDAESGKAIGSYPLGYTYADPFSIAYVRAYGVPAIYVSGHLSQTEVGYGHLIDIASGETLVTGLYSGALASTPDGKSVYVTSSLDPFVYGYRLSVKNGKLSLKDFSGSGDPALCSDIVASRDGKLVVTACYFDPGYGFDVYDGKNLHYLGSLASDPGSWPGNIEIDAGNRLVTGTTAAPGTAYDVQVFDKKGRSLGTVPITEDSRTEGQQPSAMKVSGDSTRVVSVTYQISSPQGQTLMFRSLP